MTRGLTLENFEAFIKRVVRSFNAANLDYMFTGALAASYYGTPRTTMDADVIIKISAGKEKRNEIVSTLEEAGLRVHEQRIHAALQSEFKIATFRDSKSPFTLDIIFSTRKLRKRAGTILGLPTFYQTPEDLVLAKLRMIKATFPKERTIKDKDDIEAIFRFTRVNLRTIKRSARGNSTLSILERILAHKEV